MNPYIALLYGVVNRGEEFLLYGERVRITEVWEVSDWGMSRTQFRLSNGGVIVLNHDRCDPSISIETIDKEGVKP